MELKTFVKKVQKELDDIKARATPEEIARLNFAYFNSKHTERCIYGQMTGDCDSDRAKEIRKKSIGDSDTLEKGSYYTPLEVYLFRVEADKHQEIIDYLKGIITTIDLKL